MEHSKDQINKEVTLRSEDTTPQTTPPSPSQPDAAHTLRVEIQVIIPTLLFLFLQEIRLPFGNLSYHYSYYLLDDNYYENSPEQLS